MHVAPETGRAASAAALFSPRGLEHDAAIGQLDQPESVRRVPLASGQLDLSKGIALLFPGQD
jgi:hypothetical protein